VSDEGLDYSVKGQGGVLGGSYKLGASNVWLGLRLLSVDTSVTFEQPLLPSFASDDGLQLGALTPTLTIDNRDNFFTPLRGWYLDLSIPLYRDDVGSDRDFETANLTGLWYRPLGNDLFFGLRGSAKESSGTTPFFLRPYVALRGVQALEFQGESAVEVETELRWRLGTRYSVVGFVGAGESRTSTGFGDRDESVTAGGAGFRYLIARRYGLHLGIDIAGGAGDTVLYVVFGNAWLRP
jgi:outer membrane protein assembly factor BamA